MIVFIRALLLYLLVIFFMRLMGKRQLGELQPSELVTTILISNIASLPIEDTSIPMIEGAVPIIVIAGVEMILSCISLRNKKFRSVLWGSPVILIREGKIDQNAMKRMRLSVDDLMEALRGNGVFDLKEVWYAVIETTGKINVMQKFTSRPLTAESAGIKGKESSMPAVIIADGKILKESMPAYGITDTWIRSVLRREHISAEEIFLMTADRNRNYEIIRKEKKVSV